MIDHKADQSPALHSTPELENHQLANLALANGPTTFNFESFKAEFAAHTFRDKEGHEFRFGPVVIGGCYNYFDLQVAHSVRGVIKTSLDNALEPIRITFDGDLDATRAYIHYGHNKNQGFLSALFEYLRDRLPAGSRFFAADASETKDVYLSVLEYPDSHLTRQIAENPTLREFYEVFASLSDAFGIKGTELGLTEGLHLHAFKRYVGGILGIWGRIARKGHYHRDYFATEETTETQDTYFKCAIPLELFERESLLLRSQGKIQTLRDVFLGN